ncbi:DUF2087 domain-containing protein [Streptomyces sp. NPDC007088]|uniref:DUF2087 domain-containing protein n=1 Tax=Streptomyces sp. NPDC007088 TaxID=3364773 RepID=UPI0036CCF3A0
MDRQMMSALADPERLRLFARIVLGEQESAPAQKQLGRLVKAGLVHRLADGSLAVDPAAFRRESASAPAPEWLPRRLAGFFARGRLVTVPVRLSVREDLLRHLAGALFTEGRDYTEREVNEAFARYYADTSALRRYCVGFGLLSREKDGSVYRLCTAGPQPPGER